MTTYRQTHRGPEHTSQSRVLRSGARADRGIHSWSIHLLRSRTRYGVTERRNWTVFVSAGRMRAEFGTR